jgi:hypothetical protein
MTVCIERKAGLGVEPGVAAARYAVPFSVNWMATVRGDVCRSVNGEPEGVQTSPIALRAQNELDPTPGAMLCRSKMTVPLGVLKLAKFLIASGPGTVAPGRFWIAPFESPAKDPVLELPGVSGFATVLAPVLLKNTPVALMTMLPETEAEPVRVWGGDGSDKCQRSQSDRSKKEII